MPRVWFDSSRYTVMCLLYVPGPNAVWCGTNDGIAICDSSGKLLKRALAAPGGTPGEEARRLDWDALLHGMVEDMIPLEDGSIWVRAVLGGYQMGADGRVLADWKSDTQVVESQHALIAREPRLQRYFPTVGQMVYLPLASGQIKGYDGAAWHVSGSLPEGVGVCRMHSIGGKLYAAGESGLVLTADGRHIIESAPGLRICSLSPESGLCVGSGVWLLEKGMARKISDRFMEGAGLGCLSVSPKVTFWSCYDYSELGLLERTPDDSVTLRYIQLPQGHRYRGFVHPPALVAAGGPEKAERVKETAGIWVLTSQGLVVSDMHKAEELLRIPIPKLEERWSVLVAYGVHAFAALRRDPWVLIGTGIGLARHDLRSKKTEWAWRVGK